MLMKLLLITKQTQNILIEINNRNAKNPFSGLFSLNGIFAFSRKDILCFVKCLSIIYHNHLKLNTLIHFQVFYYTLFF